MSKTNLSCQEMFASLSDYINEEIDEQTYQEIRKHLSDCGPCLNFLNTLEKTVELCRQTPGKDFQPPAIDAEVKEQLKMAFERATRDRRKK